MSVCRGFRGGPPCAAASFSRLTYPHFLSRNLPRKDPGLADNLGRYHLRSESEPFSVRNNERASLVGVRDRRRRNRSLGRSHSQDLGKIEPMKR